MRKIYSMTLVAKCFFHNILSAWCVIGTTKHLILILFNLENTIYETETKLWTDPLFKNHFTS